MPLRAATQKLRRGTALLACALVGLALAGAVSAAATSQRLALEARLAQDGDLDGFAAPSHPLLYSTAAAWAAGFSDPAKETTRLQKLGFVGAAFEHLTARTLPQRDAVSVVIRFRSSDGAAKNLAYAIASDTTGGVKVTRFAVPGIPGATGLDAQRSDGAGYDVVFADGPFFYDVGAYTPDPKQPPTAGQVIAAATKLYHRVHGHPA